MKKTVKNLIWILISFGAAISTAIVAGIVHPGEKVNALWIISAAACFYVIAYRVYASFLAAKVLALDPAIVTPSAAPSTSRPGGEQGTPAPG